MILGGLPTPRTTGPLSFGWELTASRRLWRGSPTRWGSSRRSRRHRVAKHSSPVCWTRGGRRACRAPPAFQACLWAIARRNANEPPYCCLVLRRLTRQGGAPPALNEGHSSVVPLKEVSSCPPKIPGGHCCTSRLWLATSRDFAGFVFSCRLLLLGPSRAASTLN